MIISREQTGSGIKSAYVMVAFVGIVALIGVGLVLVFENANQPSAASAACRTEPFHLGLICRHADRRLLRQRLLFVGRDDLRVISESSVDARLPPIPRSP